MHLYVLVKSELSLVKCWCGCLSWLGKCNGTFTTRLSYCTSPMFHLRNSSLYFFSFPETGVSQLVY